ncbi:MAG TPA: hypothetical protein DDZ41_05490 [Flavobacterium sp.]|nr:hypothetical protein [Flavobacterium sp.]
MKDIETREDILLIMEKFYEKLLADDSINFFFTQTTNVSQHLEAHFDILATFWEQSLFLKGGYYNNMFSIHKNVHDKQAFKKEHYDIWLHHLNETVDCYFTGINAEKMKTQGLSMTTIMQIKLN